jgi:hypothetical protein
MEVAVLELAWTISNHPVAGSIIVRASRECVLSGVFMVQGPTRSTQTMTQGSDSAVLGGKRPYFLRSFFGSIRFRIGLDNLKPPSGWINHSESKQRVCFEWGFYCKRTHQIYTNHDPGVRFCCLVDRLDKWNRNVQHPPLDQATSWCF